MWRRRNERTRDERYTRYSTHSRDWFPTHLSRENISFFVRDNHNFLKVFEIHLPWWYLETLYHEIPSHHRPKLFFYFRISRRRKKKKEKRRKSLKTFDKKFSLSLFSLKNFICHSSKDTIDQCRVHESPYVQFAISRANPSWTRVLDFHITLNFCPFSRPLDEAYTQLRVDASVSREPSPTRVRSFHERSFTRGIESNTASRVPEIKRSSKFFLRSNDLDKLKSTAVKTSRYPSTTVL